MRHRYSSPKDWLMAAERALSPLAAWKYAAWLQRVQPSPYRSYGPAPGDEELARKLIWC